MGPSPGSVTRALVAALVITLFAAPASAGLFDKFRDPETGRIDLSDSLLTGSGFLPVPIIVTEPAIGVGFGLAPALFHDFNHSREEKKSLSVEDLLEYPPSVTAVLGLYTTNSSWVAGAAHIGSYRRDTIRYTGVIGYADLNLGFYVFDEQLDFNIKGGLTFHEVKFRLGKSNWFLGGEYSYTGSEVRFDLGSGSRTSPPGTRPRDLDSSNAALTALAYYDSRDTIFTPSKGQEARISAGRHDRSLGGDFDYWRLGLDLISFHQPHPSWVLGWRLKGATTTDEPPFYGLPFVWMRGVPAMRYQGEAVGQAEAEIRWTVAGPWNVVGFVGYGDTWSDVPSLETKNLILAGGAGVRFNIAPKLGFQTGIDIARGPEEWVVYLQFGHAWTR